MSAARKIRLRSFIINNMSSTALISCRMKIDLYLLNCYPLNPSILQTMSFVNSTCLKILRITFCFTTISMKNEGNIFTSLKDLISSNDQFRDRNCCSSIFSSFDYNMLHISSFGFSLLKNTCNKFNANQVIFQ